ncbi:MAG TPA: hypothetical protein VLE96_05085 [Chlamydiales bacterium]|nr:hypothetical protein [Chlamydiales bacterium]
MSEKRQLLNLMFQNLQLRHVNLSVQVAEPFKTMVDYKECPPNGGGEMRSELLL